MLSAVLAIVLGAGIVAVAARGLTTVEARMVALCFGAHVMSALAQLWMQASFYGGSDVLVYLDYGRMLAMLLERDFLRWAPDVGRLIVHAPTSFPFYVFGETLSTGSMSGFAAIAVFVLGDAPFAIFVATATWATLGQIAMLRGGRALVGTEDERRMLAISTLLVPSVVFWSSTLAKEALTLGFLGWACWGIATFVRGRWVAGAGVAFVAAAGVALLKPYTLFPLVLAAGAALALSRIGPRRSIGPLYFVGGVGLALLGVVAMSRLFPDYAVDKIAQTTAMQQLHGAEAGGGSYTEIGNPAEQSFTGQLRYLPLALVNALFRPSLVDVRNVTTAAASLESTLLIGFVLVLVFRGRARNAWLAMRESPLLTFSVVLTAFFAVAVGLATTNLGTLSRYRMPMMPFYVFAVLDLHRRTRAAQAAQRAPLPRGLVARGGRR